MSLPENFFSRWGQIKEICNLKKIRRYSQNRRGSSNSWRVANRERKVGMQFHKMSHTDKHSWTEIIQALRYPVLKQYSLDCIPCFFLIHLSLLPLTQIPCLLLYSLLLCHTHIFNYFILLFLTSHIFSWTH